MHLHTKGEAHSRHQFLSLHASRLFFSLSLPATLWRRPISDELPNLSPLPLTLSLPLHLSLTLDIYFFLLHLCTSHQCWVNANNLVLGLKRNRGCDNWCILAFLLNQRVTEQMKLTSVVQSKTVKPHWQKVAPVTRLYHSVWWLYHVNHTGKTLFISLLSYICICLFPCIWPVMAGGVRGAKSPWLMHRGCRPDPSKVPPNIIPREAT